MQVGRLFAAAFLIAAVVACGSLCAGYGMSVAKAEPVVQEFTIEQLFAYESVSAGVDKNSNPTVWEFYGSWRGYTSGTIEVVSVGQYGAESRIPNDRVRIGIDSQRYAFFRAPLPVTTGLEKRYWPTVAVDVFRVNPEEMFAVYVTIGDTRFPLVQSKVSDGMAIRNSVY